MIKENLFAFGCVENDNASTNANEDDEQKWNVDSKDDFALLQQQQQEQDSVDFVSK